MNIARSAAIVSVSVPALRAVAKIGILPWPDPASVKVAFGDAATISCVMVSGTAWAPSTGVASRGGVNAFGGQLAGGPGARDDRGERRH